MQQIIRYYKIGNIVFRLDLPFSYKELDEYESYRVESTKADVKINFLQETFDIPIKNQSFDIDQMRITCSDDVIYMELLEGDMRTVYGCLVLPRDEKHSFKCYLYDNAKEQLPYSMQVFKVISIEHYFNLYGRYVLHASYINWRERAVLFTAPSGTGKSTQARLWNEYEDAEIINGDKVVIGEQLNKMYAYGLPYAGSSSYFVNKSFPIGAIVILKQGECNQLKRVRGAAAVKNIYSETIVHTWDKNYVEQIMNLLVRTVKDIPVFILTCTPDRSSVDLLKEELEKLYGVN